MAKRTNTAVWIEKRSMWRINVQKNGERRSFYSSTPGRAGQREANKKADDWLEGVTTSPNMKFGALCDLYIENIQSRTSKSNSRPAASRIRHWIIPEVGNTRLDSINDIVLQRVLTQARKAGLAKKTLQSLAADIRAVCKYGRQLHLFSLRPEFLTIPNGAPKSERHALTPAQIKIIMSDSTSTWRGRITQDPFINAYRLQILTGIRPSEVIGLMRSDRQGHLLLIRRGINGYGEVTNGKNENAQREIVLSDLACQVWDAQLQIISSSVLMFPDLKQRTYERALERYCQYHNIDHATPYDLRHTFVTAVQSMPEAWVKEMCGHSQAMDTFGTYGHHDNSQDKAKIDALNNIFNAIVDGQKTECGTKCGIV